MARFNIRALITRLRRMTPKGRVEYIRRAGCDGRYGCCRDSRPFSRLTTPAKQEES